MLDGANHIYSLTGMIHRFSYNEGCEVTPEMIVVGVDSKNRYNELVPSFKDDKFRRYLEDELLPFIDENYPTLPYRIFIGHSLGGLRVVHTALYQPDLFNAYIAVDPSLGNAKNEWYNTAAAKTESFDLKNKRMSVAMLQTMPQSMVQDLELIKNDTTWASNHMRKMMEFSELMSSKDSIDKTFSWKFYPNETHSSVTQIGMYDGLKFIYDYYLNKTWPDVLDGPITTQESLDIMIEYYNKVSENIGIKFQPKERLLDMIIGAIKRSEQYDKALLFSEYYLEIYPESKHAKNQIEEFKDK